jgi:hypothetical protein
MMEQNEKDIDKAARKFVADCYEIGATSCVLVGFNSGRTIRSATGRYDRLMMLLAIELVKICKQTNNSLNYGIETLREAAEECQKLIEIQEEE